MTEETNSTSIVQEAFNSESFRKMGHALIDQLADHLSSCKEGQAKVLEYKVPEEELSFWKQYQIEDLQHFFGDVIKRNIHVHHKNYIGHQVSPPAPISALAGLVSELLNVGMGIYEMGSAGTAIERVVVQEFCRAIGYPANSSDGVLTSGGTLANLTALLAARASFRLNYDQNKAFILVSEQAHFCIDRAAMVMGFSNDQIIKIKTDQDFRIDISQLELEVEGLLANGEKIMAIVGCACSTSTGSYDDLVALGKLSAKHDIWFHVDGAHGGAVVFSKKYKSLCSGVSVADSIIIDAHKMMLTPALATAVLFKNKVDSHQALAIEAAYLFENNEHDWHNLAKRTYETTKYMMSIKIFVLMRYYGLELIDEYITRQYDLTRKFAAVVAAHDHFEIAHQPMSNILCFRYTNSEENLSPINERIREQLIQDGRYFIVQTTLKGQLFLRVTIMSPHTTFQDLSSLLTFIDNQMISRKTI